MTSVTIGIVTYNAALYIIESLESVFHQSHGPLHLIISDDCSKDNTLELVKEWISQERVKQRFLSIQLLTVPANTGVSANCNRVIKASKTDWIKFHAGDDILLPNCIEDNMKFVEAHMDARVVFSQVQVYQDTFETGRFVRETPLNFPNNLFHPDFDAQKQFQILLQGDRINFTPSFFFNKKAIEQVGLYDEEQRFVEDYPMWLKLTQAGIRLHYFHQATVGYRIHSQATNNIGAALFKPSAINGFKVRKKYAHPHLPWYKVRQETWGFRVTQVFQFLRIKKPTVVNKFLYKFFGMYLNPFFLINRLLNLL